jgi:hypothetical protein
MGTIIRKYSFYLCSKSTFLTGIGQLFDVSGSYNKYNYSKSPEEADKKSLYLDWLAVGQDIQVAMNTYEQRG